MNAPNILPYVALVAWGRYFRCRHAGVLLALATVTIFSDAQCLVSTESSGKHLLTYQSRGNRCEGLLPIKVSGDSAIQLIGYHVGTFDLPLSVNDTVQLHILEAPATPSLSVQAIGRTEQVRYQMDTSALLSNQSFTWQQDIVANPGVQLKRGDFGVIACSHRCTQRRETTYWPVSITTGTSGRGERLWILMRANFRANKTAMTLQPEDGGAPVKVPADSLTFVPGRLAKVALPWLARGYYRLEVDARDATTRQPMGTLEARLFIPRQVK